MVGFDGWALLIAAVGLLLFLWIRPKSTGRRGIPLATIRPLVSDESLRLRWRNLPSTLLWVTLGALLLAFVDIHWTVRGSPSETSSEGIALYLVVDRSRSMAQKVIGGGTKLEVLKEVARRFIVSRPDDLLGLIAFARTAEVLSPLTLDHQDVDELLDEVTFVDDYNQDGTAIGYAIYKGVNLFTVTEEQSRGGGYKIASRVLVLVSDGFQDPHPDDRENRLRSMGLDEAASFARQMGVKLYVISIDPRISFPEFAAQRRQLEMVTDITGGELFEVESSADLQKVFSVIDSLEKSPLYSQTRPLRTWGLAPFLIAVGLMSLFGSVLLGTTFFRRLP